jgi:hypothetical protein
MEFINRHNHLFIRENIEFLIYSMVCFFAPFFLGHPQLVVGIVVNAALILGARDLNNQRLLPLIFMPSLGVLSRGVIFGPLTPFLIYMLPFIWIGNALMVFLFRKFRDKAAALAVSATVKTAFIALSALILISLSLIPAALLFSMSVLQITTAVAGGILALSISKLRSVL